MWQVVDVGGWLGECEEEEGLGGGKLMNLFLKKEGSDST